MTSSIPYSDQPVNSWRDEPIRRWPRADHQHDPYAWQYDLCPLIPRLLPSDCKLIIVLWARAIRGDYRFALSDLRAETGLGETALSRSLANLKRHALIDLEPLRLKAEGGGYVSRFALRPGKVGV